MNNTYGDEIRISNCLVGGNLNLGVVRGFAPIDLLSYISSADLFDQTENKFGTQRDLSVSHSKEASAYAVESLGFESSTDPRAFPEIVLNVRDTSVVSLWQNGKELDFSSGELFEGGPIVVEVIVKTSALDWPPLKYSPKISRVDGNHRLSRVPEFTDRDESQVFPTIPFALFIGLSPNQERKLFRDINGTQKSMSTSHLNQITISLDGDSALLDRKNRSLWIAKQLSGHGRVFDGLIFLGGAKTGVRASQGSVPPITLSALKSMVNATLLNIEAFVAELFPNELIESARTGHETSIATINNRGTMLVDLIESFWFAVKENYPEAWQDKKNYVLLQSIGLMALSQFAGVIIQELKERKDLSRDAFMLSLKDVKAANFTFAKTDYQGVAGAAGAKLVYQDLVQAKAKGGNGILSLLEQSSFGATSALDA